MRAPGNLDSDPTFAVIYYFLSCWPAAMADEPYQPWKEAHILLDRITRAIPNLMRLFEGDVYLSTPQQVASILSLAAQTCYVDAPKKALARAAGSDSRQEQGKIIESALITDPKGKIIMKRTLE
jgi:hypothetical protein